MVTTSEHYQAQATACLDSAASERLENKRRQWLEAAAKWQELADQASRTAESRTANAERGYKLS